LILAALAEGFGAILSVEHGKTAKKFQKSAQGSD